MAMYKQGNAIVTTPIVDPGKWLDKKTPASRIKIAQDKIDAFDPSKWLLSHVSIMASVDVDTADSGKCKQNEMDYLIKPEYSMFVNNNGDSWERNLLKACSKTFLGADNFCFCAGTRVLMSDGTYKNIEEIKVGDKVINRKGDVAFVKNVFKRKSSDIYKISSSKLLSNDVYATGNHPFWVYHAREACPKTGRPNNFKGNKWFNRLDEFYGYAKGVHPSESDNFGPGLTSKWIETENLNVDRDFFTSPMSSLVVPDNEINDNRAELIGWFLAEGSYTNVNKFSEEESGIQYSLGNDEYDVAIRLSKILDAEFSDWLRPDCKPRIYETQSGSWNIFLCNAKVAKFFITWCGKYSWAKKLNEKVLWLPVDQQAIILNGLFNGDGTDKIRNRGISLELKSKDLIQQLIFISWRLGLNPTYRETKVLPRYSSCEVIDGHTVFTDPETGKKSRPGYKIQYSTKDSEVLNSFGVVLNKKYGESFGTKSSSFSNEEGKWILSKIEEVKKEHYFEDNPVEVFNIEVEEDNSYIVEGVAVHNCEHVQIPELSKGKVIDVALREVPFTKKDGKDLTTLYVDILIATNKKHVDLVQKITSGEYNATSMGCLIKYSQCSQCGNIAEDDTQACNHVRFFKNNYFYDPNGVRRIIAELCGRASDPDSCKFIDASWVRKPAFEGAVLRNILDIGSDNQDVSEKIKSVINIPAFIPQEGMLLRAASEAADSLTKEIIAAEGDDPAPPADDTSFPEPSAETPSLPTDTGGEAPADDAPADGAPAEGGGDAPAADPGAEAAPPPPIDEPIDDATTKEVRDMLKKQVLNKIRKELLQEESKGEERPVELENRINDSLVKEASDDITFDRNIKKVLSCAKRYTNNEKIINGIHILANLKSWSNIRKYGYSRDDVLGLLYHIDKTMSNNPVGSDAVKALSRIRLASDNLKGFFTEIIIETGRKPSSVEAKKIAKWGRILSNFD